MQAFATNPDVAFGDVNLAEDQVRETPVGGDHNPGAGGWPTVKYFNKETVCHTGLEPRTSDP